MIDRDTFQLGKGILYAGILSLSALTVSPVLAVSCKKVTVKATNQTGKTVKIYDLDYYDFEDRKWRSEPTPNKVVRGGGVWSKTSNLGGVGGERTKIRIKYKVKSNGRYGSMQSKDSASAVCKKGKRFAVVLPGPASAIAPPPEQDENRIRVLSGTYFGEAKDGRTLEQNIRPNTREIQMKRRGSSDPYAVYSYIGNNTYRHSGGSKIVVQSNSFLVWVSAKGKTKVGYTRKR